MTDKQALLAAILADPKDDTPRLVYADWLQEHGQEERAEFIRVQCELARREITRQDHAKMERMYERYLKRAPIPLKAKTNAVLLLRGRLLLSSRQPGTSTGDPSDNTFASARYVWAGPVAKLHDWEGAAWSFTRGFVSHLTCPWPDWRDHADAILAEQPVERVKLTTRPEFEEDGQGNYRLVGVDGNWGNNSDLAQLRIDLLQDRWPGIEFELPAERDQFWVGLEEAGLVGIGERERLNDQLGGGFLGRS